MLILASGSPRRRELLTQLEVEFTIEVPNIDESPRANEAPRDLVQRLALEKAQAIAAQHPEAWVLGSDTIVTRAGVVYGKPEHAVDAVRMLTELAGQTHEVMTAVALVCAAHEHSVVELEVARVTMHDNSIDTITRYVATGEPMDKAGAYAVQGLGRELVAQVEGDESAVIGLPLDLTCRLLAEM